MSSPIKELLSTSSIVIKRSEADNLIEELRIIDRKASVGNSCVILKVHRSPTTRLITKLEPVSDTVRAEDVDVT